MSVSSRRRPTAYHGLLRISQAAALLGVSSETLRNWDKWGWLSPIRNPLTGYRYYRQEDLKRFLKEHTAECPIEQ